MGEWEQEKEVLRGEGLLRVYGGSNKESLFILLILSYIFSATAESF